ncbi:unnamed protein product [marine sediment metagenome]|uniref:Uncharacterized protein n=1 Tax=marine sediment metagenome TaxID=412755 RepID=X1A173_9ZZZZ
MDAKNKICLMLATFFVLLLLSLCVLKAQAGWFNDLYGPVSPVPDPGPPVPADGNNGNNTSDLPFPTPALPTVSRNK